MWSIALTAPGVFCPNTEQAASVPLDIMGTTVTKVRTLIFFFYLLCCVLVIHTASYGTNLSQTGCESPNGIGEKTLNILLSFYGHIRNVSFHLTLGLVRRVLKRSTLSKKAQLC